MQTLARIELRRMLRRLLCTGGLLAFVLCGCKSGNLATRQATEALDASVFSASNAVQTLSFTSGEPRTPKADAVNSFLYAKHWLDCKDTQPGLFSRVAVCTLNAAGRTFGQQNKWTVTRPPAGCTQCEVWTVPLARATLRSITDISASDKTHAVATYTYAVVPNAFGGDLGDWMTKNSGAWCGADPRAAGLWGTARAGKANFVRTGGAWTVAEVPTDFENTFAAPSTDRPCAAP